MKILITGGSSGLGNAIVKLLSKDDNNSIFFTFNCHEEEAKQLEVSGKNCKAIHCDFTVEASVSKLCEMIPSLDLDVLVNNAYVGNAQNNHFHKIQPEEFLQSFQNNLIPAIKITQEAIKVFRKKKFGKIINIITSYVINTPPIGCSMYAANKAYLLQLSKSWSNEYAKFNITSNCISPELMETNLSKDLDFRIIEQMIDTHPLKKLLTPEEVAETVKFLIETSQQINGVNIPINAAKNIL
jgi:NAD(P)-dependent dehydrogenase (short-subunit alcohol dehydrogenase family)